MRKAIKYSDSEIIKKNLVYKTGRPGTNKKIRNILLKEQKGYCVYTEEYLSRTDARDIDHFNPNLKNKQEDNYYNWFLVKHQWNKEKSSKWKSFQPTLHPTAEDLENRIVYLDGDYFAKSEKDVEAKNLISLLKLDNPDLAINRRRYIKRIHDLVNLYDKDVKSVLSILINKDICQIYYLRAIKEEFDLDIWEMLT